MELVLVELFNSLVESLLMCESRVWIFGTIERCMQCYSEEERDSCELDDRIIQVTVNNIMTLPASVVHTPSAPPCSHDGEQQQEHQAEIVDHADEEMAIVATNVERVPAAAATTGATSIHNNYQSQNPPPPPPPPTMIAHATVLSVTDPSAQQPNDPPPPAQQLESIRVVGVPIATQPPVETQATTTTTSATAMIGTMKKKISRRRLICTLLVLPVFIVLAVILSRIQFIQLLVDSGS